MQRRIRTIVGSSLALAALAVGAGAWMGGGQDVTGAQGPSAGQQSGSPGTRADHHRFTIPFAQSLNGTFVSGLTSETFVKIINDSDTAIDVRTDWFFGFGGLAGTSGPFSIPPHESRMMFTSNIGEDVAPFFQNEGFRDTDFEFSGFARVYVGPNTGSAKNVTVQAMLLTDMDSGQAGVFGINARTSTDLHVDRADDADLDGIVDTRFKGD